MDFSLRSATELLQRVEAETGLLTRIRSSSEAKSEVFARYWQPMISAVADYVQECPLEQICFSEPGGLLRYALMSAYYSLQIANQQFFTGKHGAEERRVLVPQYRFAVFFATLAGIPATMHGRVIVRAGSKTWTPFHSTPALNEWVAVQGANRFSIEWRLSEMKISQANALVWAADIVGIGTWQNLAEEVAMLAHDAIYQIDTKTGESPVTSCVRLAYRTAREFETRAMTGKYQKRDLPDGVTPETIEKFGEALASQGTATAKASSQQPSEGEVASTERSAKDSAQEQLEASQPAHGGETNAQDSTAPTPAAPQAQKYPDIILDIFKAIRAQEDYDRVRKQCNETESGIAVPVTIFSKHGLPASKVMQILDQHKLVVQISDSRKSLILEKAVRPLLFG